MQHIRVDEQIEKIGEWHGWAIATHDGKHKVAYHVGYLPGRKQVALYRVKDGTLTTVAFFKRPREAQQFLGFLDKLAGER